MSKESGPVLVVVDMQPSFPAARSKTTIKNCAREILNAIRLRHRIIFLEYVDSKPTHQTLTNLCEKVGYGRCSIVVKYEDDGTSAIFAALNELGRDGAKTKFTVCGVNTDACVKRTVFGLSKHARAVEVVKDACNQPDYFTGTKNAPFEKMKKRRNVHIV